MRGIKLHRWALDFGKQLLQILESKDFRTSLVRKSLLISLPLAIIASFYFTNLVFAVGNDCQSNVVSGNWNAAGSWTNCGGTTPQPADNVTILNGHTITLNVAGSVTNLTINSGGALTVSGSNGLTIAGSYANAGTFTASTGTVTFSSTTTGKTLSGTLNGSSAFYKVVFNGVGGGWTIQDAMQVLTANTEPISMDIANGTVTLGNGDGDNLEVDGNLTIANTADQTATFQTATLSYPSQVSLLMDNYLAAGSPCASCKISVGASSGTGQGNFKLTKSGRLQVKNTNGTSISLSALSTGYVEMTGSADVSGATITDTDTLNLRETTICTATPFTGGAHNSKKVRITSGLAIGRVYPIVATNATDANCANNGDSSITKAGNTEPDATVDTIAGSGSTRRICTSITSSNDWLGTDPHTTGRYLRDKTGTTGYFLITADPYGAYVDDGCPNDTLSLNITNYPTSSFAGIQAGDTIDLSDGIRPGDTFDVVDPATMTFYNSGNDCTATARSGSINGAAGSQFLLQNAQVCDLSTVAFNSINGANSNEGVAISGSYFSNLQTGMSFTSSSNNNFSNNYIAPISNHSALTVSFSGSSNNTVSSNKLYNGRFDLSGSSTGNTFSSNTIRHSASLGMNMNSSGAATGNTFDSNTIMGNLWNGVDLDSSRNTFSNNTLRGNQESGLEVEPNAKNNIISNNTIIDNYGDNAFSNFTGGIHVSSAYQNIFLSNTITDNYTDGINLENSSGNTFKGNTIEGNGGRGINFDSTSTYNTSSHNEFSTNNVGIYDQGNNNSTIVDTFGTDGANLAKDLVRNPTNSSLQSQSFGSSFTSGQASGGFAVENGHTGSHIVGVAYDNYSSTGRLAMFYDDGTYTVTHFKTDVTSDGYIDYQQTFTYGVAAGETYNNIIGITEDGNTVGALAIFYLDGTYSVSFDYANLDTTNSWRADNAITPTYVHNFTLAAGKTTSQVIAVEQDVWWTGDLTFFYGDGTFSRSNSWDPGSDVDASIEVHNYTLATGKTAADVVDVSNDFLFGGMLAIWYNDGTYSLTSSGFNAGTDAAASDYFGTSKSAPMITYKSGGTAGAVSIWGGYSVPSDNAETPQVESSAKFNYANNLWEKSVTPHYYKGTGTQDSNLSYNVTSANLASGPYTYNLIVKTASAQCDGTAGSAVFDVWRNGVDVGDAYCGESYTDSNSSVNVGFKVDQGATIYVVKDSYTFTAYDASGDTNTQKTVTIVNDSASVTVPSGRSLEIKGQNATTNKTLLTRGGSSGGYHISIAGTIDAQYYILSYLGGTNGAVGLDLQAGATVTNLADGIYNNYQNVGGSDTYVKIDGSLIGTGTPSKTFANVTFSRNSSNPEFSVTESGGAPVAGNYWLFDTTASCTGWASCEASDSDTGDGGSDTAGFIHFSAVISGFSLSGTVFGTDEVTALTSGPLVRVKVNGSGDFTANASVVDGTYSIGSITMSAGDALTVYLDTNGGVTGSTFTVSTGAAMSGIDIYQDRATTRCDNSCSLTNTNINSWDKDNDTDIHAEVASSNFVVDNDWKLLVKTDTFAPGGTVGTVAGGSQSYSGYLEISSGATLNMAGNALTIGGSYRNSGTLTTGSNTTTFNATTSGNSLNGILNSISSFNNLVFDSSSGTGDWTINSTMAVPGNLTVSAGVLKGVTDITVNGDVIGAGQIDITGGTFEQRVAANQNFGTTSGTNDWTFSNLTFSNSSVLDRTITTSAGGTGKIITTGIVTVGKSTDTNKTVYDQATNDRGHQAKGNLTISTQGELHASNQDLIVQGDWTNNGHFVANHGRVVLNGSTPQTVNGTLTGSDAFYNLTVDNISGVVPTACAIPTTPTIILPVDTTVDNNYDITTGPTVISHKVNATYRYKNINWKGKNAGKIIFRKSANVTGKWKLIVTGTQTEVTNVNAGSSDASGGNTIVATATSNVDCGDNINWTFPPESPVATTTSPPSNTPIVDDNPPASSPETTIPHTPQITPVTGSPVLLPTTTIVSSAIGLASMSTLTGLLLLPPFHNMLTTGSISGIPVFNFIFFGYIPSRRRKNKWGVVLNHASRVPIPGVFVELISAEDNKLIHRLMTDRTGRYGFLVDQAGKYYVRIQSPLYERYQSSPIIITNPANDVVAQDILLHANEPAQHKHLIKVAKLFNVLGWITSLHWPVLIIGTILSIYLFLRQPHIEFGLILFLYALIWVSKIGRFGKGRPYGKVTDKTTGLPQPLTVVQLTAIRDGVRNLIVSVLTDKRGRFLFVVQPNDYLLIAAKEGYAPFERSVDDETTNSDIMLKPSPQSSISKSSN